MYHAKLPISKPCVAFCVRVCREEPGLHSEAGNSASEAKNACQLARNGGYREGDRMCRTVRLAQTQHHFSKMGSERNATMPTKPWAARLRRHVVQVLQAIEANKTGHEARSRKCDDVSSLHAC